MLTLAVILPAYTADRLGIESQLTSQASVEIVKERPMELEASEYLAELFPNAPLDQLTAGQVWVYVLQTPAAVAEIEGVVLSPDAELAEAQIAALFASSPVYELDDAAQLSPSSGAFSPSSTSLKSPSSSQPSSVRSPGGSLFKARPLPSSTHSPEIVPRPTRSTMLRQTSATSSSSNPTYFAPVGKPRVALTKERLMETFDGIPGHKRRESIQVASTSSPKIIPRLTKAAALRLGIEMPKFERPKKAEPPKKEEPKQIEKPKPELHRRASSIAPPSIAPRLNKSATLRTQPKAPPTSFMFRAPTNGSGSTSRPGSAQSMRRPSSTQPRAPSTTSLRPPLHNAFPSTNSVASTSSTTSDAEAALNGKATPKPLKPVRAPSIVPRSNKSALLRAAKKEEEEREMREKEQRKAKASRRRTLMV